MKAVFDTCILIDLLRGIEAAAEEIERYRTKLISSITWMEVMCGCTANNETATRRFLANFTLYEVSAAVAEEAVKIRRQQRTKLPDAIIYATARCTDALLVTRNIRDFDESEPDVRIPYGV